MMHPAFAQHLTPDEKHEVHNARVVELITGQISGKEFIDSLRQQCGLSDIDAKRQWQDIKNVSEIAIYETKCGDIVYAPFRGKFFPARIIAFYGNRVGAVVKFECLGVANEAQVPFALFELRAKE